MAGTSNLIHHNAPPEKQLSISFSLSSSLSPASLYPSTAPRSNSRNRSAPIFLLFFINVPPLPSCSLFISFIRSLVLLPWQQQAHEAYTFTAGYIKWRARDGERSGKRERRGALSKRREGISEREWKKRASMRREIVRKRETTAEVGGKGERESQSETEVNTFFRPTVKCLLPTFLPPSLSHFSKALLC